MSESIVLDIRNLKSHFFTAKGEVPAVDGRNHSGSARKNYWNCR